MVDQMEVGPKTTQRIVLQILEYTFFQEKIIQRENCRGQESLWIEAFQLKTIWWFYWLEYDCDPNRGMCLSQKVDQTQVTLAEMQYSGVSERVGLQGAHVSRWAKGFQADVNK